MKAIFKKALRLRDRPVSILQSLEILNVFNIKLLSEANVKVLEYLRTCNMFYLTNGPRFTFGIFDWHVKEEYFKLSNNIKIIRN